MRPPLFDEENIFEIRGILGNCVCGRFVSENKCVDRQRGRRGCGREGLAVSPPGERRGLPALPSSLMPGKFFIVLVSFRVTADAGVGMLGGCSAYPSNPPPFLWADSRSSATCDSIPTKTAFSGSK